MVVTSAVTKFWAFAPIATAAAAARRVNFFITDEFIIVNKRLISKISISGRPQGSVGRPVGETDLISGILRHWIEVKFLGWYREQLMLAGDERCHFLADNLILVLAI